MLGAIRKGEWRSKIGVGVGIGIAPRPVWHLAFLDRSNFAAKWCQHRNNTVAVPGFSCTNPITRRCDTETDTETDSDPDPDFAIYLFG